MAKVRKEVEPSCCCVSSAGGSEAHVLLEKCPIKRELGQREVKDFRTQELRKEVTCFYFSSFDGLVVPRCEHYRGLKQVQRNKQKVWRVFCEAITE